MQQRFAKECSQRLLKYHVCISGSLTACCLYCCRGDDCTLFSPCSEPSLGLAQSWARPLIDACADDDDDDDDDDGDDHCAHLC